jgi:hypothetical protein
MAGLSSKSAALLHKRDTPPTRPTVLIEKLEATRQGMAHFRTARRLLDVSLIVLMLAGLLAATDWWWVLGAGVRTAGLLGLALLTVILLGRSLLGARRTLDRPDVAVDVEAAFPQLGQRVRTTLEYGEPTANTPPASGELVRALVADTSRRTGPLDFRGLVPWRSLLWPSAGLAVLILLFAVLLAWNAELRIAALRLLLVPVHYTRVAVTPGDHTLREGEEVSIEATLTGRPVATAELCYRPSGSGEEWTKRSLAPADAAGDQRPQLLGTLQTTLKGCNADLEYRIVAGPVETPLYHLTVLHPLRLKKFEAVVHPPTYTRRPDVVVKERDLQVIAGSSILFRITLDREPQTAKLLRYPAGGSTKDNTVLPLQVRGSELTGELAAVEREVEYEIVAEAADGMKLEPSRARIQVQRDRRPTVRFLKPKEQIEVTPSTEVRMRVEAGDDFGLSQVGIVYQIGNGPKKTLHLQRDSRQPATLHVEATLALEDHPVSFQDGVTYYAFAEDNHPTRPQRTTTELQFIDIRPYKRAYQMLETGGS